MSTAQQRSANRRNATRSTGPRTQAGKARSRLNSLRHGLGADVSDLPLDPEEQRLMNLLQECAVSAELVKPLKGLVRAQGYLNRVRVHKIKVFDALERAIREAPEGDADENIQRISPLISEAEQILEVATDASRRAQRYESKSLRDRRAIFKLLMGCEGSGELWRG